MTTAAVLIAAMLLDAALGEPKWLWTRMPHPAVLMGRAVAALDQQLNKGAAQFAKGVIALGILIVGAYLTALLLGLFGPLVEVIVVAILLAQRSLVDHVAAVATGLRMSLSDGRQAVAMIVSRDTAQMDEAAVARSAIESAAENLSDGVIAPAFWFLIAGLPGIMIYKVVNTADSMIGYRTPRHEQFGKAAARIDDLMNWIPARMTCALLALPAGVLGMWRQIAADARHHRSPNAGWPEAAMARAISVALAGPRAYDGRMQDFAWVNGSAARAIGPADIDAAIQRLWQAWSLMLACAFLFVLID